MTTKPPILKAGDTFGIVTLGSPPDAGVVKARIAYLESLGFRVVLGDSVYARDGFLAGTDQKRADDLMKMYRNPIVKAILPTRGGVGVQGILPYLDYTYIAENSKIISGYSDITILLNILYQFSNQITFHSLMLIDFRNSTPAYNFNQYFAATSTMVSPRKISNPPGMPTVSKVKGNVTGPLVGGNITSFLGSLGTPYEIDTKGKIFFIEETHEPVNTVYRYLSHLKSAGKFQDCIGIVMGECSGCTDEYDKSYQSLIDEVMVPLGKPLMTNLASGHGVYKATLPIGAMLNLNTDENTLTLLESTVR